MNVGNSGGAGRPARRFALLAVGTAAALLAAGCASAKPGGQAMSPVQAILLAARQARDATSFSWSMSVKTSGLASGTMAGTLQMRTKPLVYNADFSTVNFGGQAVPGGIHEILTGHTLYIKVPGLARRIGKPWLKVSFAQIQKRTGISFTQIIQQAQQDNPLVQTQMLAGAKNVRVAGHQVIDGVPTTEYTGTFTVAAALARLPSTLRPVERAAMRKLGITSARFSVWIDGQHRSRKIIVSEQGTLEAVTLTMAVTSVNQPVSVAPPPANQVATIP